MSASILKWKMTVNQLRYLYEELHIVKTMADEMGPEFQNIMRIFVGDTVLILKL